MDVLKKILKIVAILAAIAGVIILVKKIIDKKKAAETEGEENYVSCSCCEAPAK